MKIKKIMSVLLAISVLLSSMILSGFAASAADDPLYVKLVQVDQNGFATDFIRWETDHSAKTFRIEVRSNANWEVIDENFLDENWLNVEEPQNGKGNGNGSIILSVQSNPTWENRPGQISLRVTDEKGGSGWSLSVSQNYQIYDSFALSTKSLSFPANPSQGDDGKLSVNVGINGYWKTQVTMGANWLSTEGVANYDTKNKTFKVKALPNKENRFNNREGEITLTGHVKNSETIRVTQPPMLALESTLWENKRNEIEKTINVKSAVDWYIASKPSWLEAERTAENKLYIKLIQDNPNEERRNEKIIIKDINNDPQLTREFEVSQIGIPFLRVPDEPWNASPGSSVQTITFNTNTAWTVTENLEWLSVSPATGENYTSNENATVTINVTPAMESRTGVFTISGDGVSDTYTIHQARGENVIDVSNDTITNGYNWSYSNSVYSVHDHVTITGSSSSKRILIKNTGSPIEVELHDLSISSSEYAPIELESGANAIIKLSNRNTLSNSNDRPAIQTTGATLTFESGIGAASLNASADRGAGIGGRAGGHAGDRFWISADGESGQGGGNVTVNGGRITATSGSGAGIGGGSGGRGDDNEPLKGGDGGNGGSGGILRINGGTVEASSSSGAAIGGGNGGRAGHGGFNADGSAGSMGAKTEPILPHGGYTYQVDYGTVQTASGSNIFQNDNSYRHVRLHCPMSLSMYEWETYGRDDFEIITVSAMSEWSANAIIKPGGEADWITINCVDNVIEISVKANTTGIMRDADINVTCEGLTQKILVQQYPIGAVDAEEAMFVNIIKPRHLETFSFVPNRNRKYSVSAADYGNDQPQITLYNSDNEELANGDNALNYEFAQGETYYIEAGLSGDATGEYMLSIDPFYDEWAPGVAYEAGVILECGTENGVPVLFIVLQAHTSAEYWHPSAATSLYKRMEIPEWTQPLNTIDAYVIGDKVRYNGKIWICTFDGNVWAPGVFGWEIFE